MRTTDVAIIGGGLAGSTAAAMLGRAGIDAIMVDPHRTYPEDFRCEKFDASQVRLLERTGLADAVLPAAAPTREVWIARRGRLVERLPTNQIGFAYDAAVNAMRAAIPPATTFIEGKAASFSLGEERQTVHLVGGDEISARLVVMANGLNSGLRQNLGMRHDVRSPGHSISIGFDVVAREGRELPFSSLTYYPERTDQRIAYLTFFPIRGTMRANLFCYRDMRDPWLKAMRTAPLETMVAAMPGLAALTGDFDVAGFVKIRPVDLYVTAGHRQAGIVLVGDAFSTSCPAAGTGANKVLTDVERLCSVHIPAWLKTPGMGADKIGLFYDDPVKQRCDAESTAKAYFLRSLSTETGASWRARRFARFIRQSGRGATRSLRDRLAFGAIPRRVAGTSG
jgi:2-polyprenyl-6-methoxyphenol hydroxylase-like FAD-dependent oxidoreductase